MLRCGNQIRLTPKEQETFRAYAGGQAALPKTLDNYKAQLHAAANYWDAGDSAEEKLLAAMTRQLAEEV